jgi:voltage-gated potassium channel
VGSDSDNISITLSAKSIYPGLLVVARAYDEEAESKLKRAGADRVVFPLRLGGRRMAMLTLHPLVIDFIETATTYGGDREIFLEDIQVGPGSPLAGVTIKQGQSYSKGIAILAVKKKDGTLLTNASPDTLLEIGDELVVIGSREKLRTLEG